MDKSMWKSVLSWLAICSSIIVTNTGEKYSTCSRSYFDKPLCLPGTYINVTSVKFGSWSYGKSSGMCSSIESDCEIELPISTVIDMKKKCNGNVLCDRFTAPQKALECLTNLTYGMSSQSRHQSNYMTVVYDCITGTVRSNHIRLGIGHHFDNLLCGITSTISIQEAYDVHVSSGVYGPFSTSDCVQFADMIWINTICGNNTSVCQYAPYLNRSMECNDTSVSSQYIDIFYQCNPRPDELVTIQQRTGTTMNFSCSQPMIIRDAFMVKKRDTSTREITRLDCVRKITVGTSLYSTCNNQKDCQYEIPTTQVINCNQVQVQADVLVVLVECTDFNDHGMYGDDEEEKMTVGETNKSRQLIMVVVPVVGGVLLIAAVVTGVVIYRRRGKRTHSSSRQIIDNIDVNGEASIDMSSCHSAERIQYHSDDTNTRQPLADPEHDIYSIPKPKDPDETTIVENELYGSI